jgi:integrase/recombinase XerD
MASLFQRGGVWYVRFKDIDGQWKQESCGRGLDKKQAEVVALEKRKLEINMRHKAPVCIIKTTMIDQINAFRNSEITRPVDGRMRRRNTIKRYQAILDGFLQYCEDHQFVKYSDFGIYEAEKFFEYLVVEKKYSASCISKYRLTLINFFDWSLRQHFIKESPMTTIKNPKKVKRIPFYYSHDQLTQIFANATGVYQNIFRFLYLTGLRIGELGNAQWEHFDSVTNSLIIPLMEGNKTPREESIPIENDALEIIREQKRNLLKVSTPDSRKYIFINEKGGKVDNGNMERNFYIARNRSGIAKGSPHTLRHTFASHLAIAGYPLQFIQRLLRHASIRETEIYAHLCDAAPREAIKSLSAAKPSLNLSKFKPELLATANAG